MAGKGNRSKKGAGNQPNKSNQNYAKSRWHAVKSFGEKFLEHELMTLIAKGIFWIYSNYTFVFTVVASAFTYAVQNYELGSGHPLLVYAHNYPSRIYFAVIAIALLSPVIRALISVAFRLVSFGFSAVVSLLGLKREHEEENFATEESAASLAETLVQATGITGFSPHATRLEKKADWVTCNEKIRGNKAIDLRIMGATGWRTFGDKTSPLYKLLEQFHGEVKILLMKPDPSLPALIDRARELSKTPEEYVEEIKKSIVRLTELKKKGRNISLKLYCQTPIWKMIICNDYMWLQHYCKNKEVENTPVYTFFSDGDGGTSLFNAIYSVWIKRWDIDGNEKFELSAA